SSVLCASVPARTSGGFEFLKVAPSEFVGTVKDVVEILQDVTSILNEFGGSGFGDSRLSNAVSDCIEMLDLSSDALTWSVDATQTPKGTNTVLSLLITTPF
ncbi:pectinesterase, partial [Trifolium pratense]